MKSSIVLATLVSLTVAGPIAARDDCSCEPFMCIAQEGKQCECELDAAKRCHETHVNSGLNCPFPDVSEQCSVFSILPINLPEVTPVPAPQIKRVAKPDDPEDPCECPFQCLAQVGPDCECEVREKLACQARQQAAGNQCPPPTFTGRCAEVAATATGSAPTPTATVGKEGDRCDAFTFPRQPPCGPGLECIHDNPEVSDIGGTCQPRGQEGDECNAFTSPPQPPCASDLICVEKDPQVSDIGGTCQKPGQEGDDCESGRGSTKPCAEGLTCQQESSPCINPNAPCPGTCKKLVSYAIRR